MKKLLLVGILAFALLTPLLVQTAMSTPEPEVGLGVLVVVSAPKDPQGNYKVNPGIEYTFNITEVEFNHADISVHGNNTDGSAWSIVIGIDIAETGTMANGRGWYYSFTVTIPSTAGCTGVVHYVKGASDTSGNPDKDDKVTGETHVAAEEPAASWVPANSNNGQKPGHFKVYYPGGGAIPCLAVGVPEFPFASAVVTSLGLIGALLVRRRIKKV